jgi:hypothetical protein
MENFQMRKLPLWNFQWCLLRKTLEKIDKRKCLEVI